MSPHTVANFTSELVMMAKAVEELPHVKQELEHINEQLIEALERNQKLELRLMDRHNEIEALHAQVRTAEASRDDAELRFLFAEERTSSALAFVRSTFGSAGALIQALDPKAEAKVVEPDSPALHEITTGESVNPLPNAGSGSSDTLLATASSTSSQGSSPEAYYESMPAVDETLSAPVASEVGKSDVDPIVSTYASPISETASTENVTSDNVACLSEPKPYSGLCYFDVPGYLTLTEWLAGGGTEALYFNRRTA